MLTQGFRKFYGSITEVPKTIFQQNVELLDGPRFENCSLHPYFTKYTLILCFSADFFPKLYKFHGDGCFSFETLRNFMDYATMLAFPFGMLRNFTDYTTMLVLTFGMLRNFTDYATMLVLRVPKGTNKVRKPIASVPGRN